MGIIYMQGTPPSPISHLHPEWCKEMDAVISPQQIFFAAPFSACSSPTPVGSFLGNFSPFRILLLHHGPVSNLLVNIHWACGHVGYLLLLCSRCSQSSFSCFFPTLLCVASFPFSEGGCGTWLCPAAGLLELPGAGMGQPWHHLMQWPHCQHLSLVQRSINEVISTEHVLGTLVDVDRVSVLSLGGKPYS